jgi:hypothetical protein
VQRTAERSPAKQWPQGKLGRNQAVAYDQFRAVGYLQVPTQRLSMSGSLSPLQLRKRLKVDLAMTVTRSFD